MTTSTATKTQTEYRIVLRDNDNCVITAGVFLNEADADKYAQNAGVGEGYKVEKFIETNTVDEIDWLDIRNEKYADDAKYDDYEYENED